MYSVDPVLMDWAMLTLIAWTDYVLTLASLSNLAKRSLRMRTSSSGSHVAESAEKTSRNE